MGIRYLAISISEADFDHLSARPERKADRHRTLTKRVNALDLDKSWGFLRRFLAESGPRPAVELVAGDVTHTPARGGSPTADSSLQDESAPLRRTSP